MTTLAENAVRDLRLAESCYCRCELTAPWGLDSPGCDGVAFHFVADGECVLLGRGEETRLLAGDLVVFPTGAPHRLADTTEPDAAWTLDLGSLEPARTMLHHGGGGRRTVLLCGGAILEPAGSPYDQMLADVLVVRAGELDERLVIELTLTLMEAEAWGARIGAETSLARLCDVLVIQAIRAWMSRASDESFAPGGDERVAEAIRLVHHHPERPWTAKSLAAAVHLSPSAFTRRFTAATGVGPASFVARHRMDLATALLRDRGLAPSEVAARVGYGSVEAFSRAYKRTTGRTPGAVRRPRA